MNTAKRSVTLSLMAMILLGVTSVSAAEKINTDPKR